MTHQDAPATRISIIVPTFNRPDGLTRTLESLFALEDASLSQAELLVADNSPDANAEALFATLTANAPIPVKYVSETQPGVSNVRNTALKQAEGRLVAWLDDDQTAGQGWLDELVHAHETYNAAVSFGPTQPVLPENVLKHRSYFSRFFERPQRAENGVIQDYFGCGHSLCDMQQIHDILPDGAEVFDLEANDLGGEDDRLFQKVLDAGRVIAWNRKAVAYEHPPEHRVNLSYTLQRSFVYGQGPTNLAARKSPPDVLRVIYWMGVGAGQASVYGLAALVARLSGQQDWVYWADRAIRGVGKLLWFPPFQLRFYGSAYNNRKKKNETPQTVEDASPSSQPVN